MSGVAVLRGGVSELRRVAATAGRRPCSGVWRVGAAASRASVRVRPRSPATPAADGRPMRAPGRRRALRTTGVARARRCGSGSRTVRIVATLTNGLPSRKPVSNSVEFGRRRHRPAGCGSRCGRRCRAPSAASRCRRRRRVGAARSRVTAGRHRPCRNRRSQLDGAALDVAAGDMSSKAGQDEVLVDVPFVFAFQQFIHAVGFPESPPAETSPT